MTPTRRTFVRSALLGCSAAAFPLATRVTFAAAPGENRLVVIILRGAMDGLSAVAPYGDPALKRLRPNLAVGPESGGADLDGRFAMHDALGPLLPLWRSGELAFAHAVSTPYRDKRSHFDGQDFLENGGGAPSGAMTPARDGWLNRALGQIPGAHARTAVAVGRERMILLEGPSEALSWAPDGDVRLSEAAAALLMRIYAADPLFAAAGREALALDAQTDAMGARGGVRETAKGLAAFAAEMLNGESRIAAFSIGGFDTHSNQARAVARPLGWLADAIATLRDDLGGNWGRTAVLCMTEFGRTARENGSRGTDHGTGGLMVMAGGALAGAKVHGRWPGLGDGDLYKHRDLMPTEDLRRYAGWALRDLYGLDAGALERSVFPGLDLGANPKFIA